MIEDLPQNVLEEIYNGRRSPVLPISITDDDGNTIKARTRFAFVRLDDGEADVMFYPQLKKNDLERFSPDVENPEGIAPRNRKELTPETKIRLTPCSKIKMTPVDACRQGIFV
jgi:hypothetical protein